MLASYNTSDDIFSWWQTLLGDAPAAALLADENGVICQCNAAAEDLAQLPRSSIIGKHYTQLADFPEAEAERAAHQFTATVKRNASGPSDYAILRRDGTPRTIEVRGNQVVVNNHRYIAISIGDVSERREAEEQVRSSEARLARAQRSARIGVWEWDLVTGRMWWSDEMYNIFRRDPETWTPNLDDFFPLMLPEDHDKIVAPPATPKGDLEPYAFTARFEVVPGDIRYLRVEGVVDCDDQGRPAAMIGSTQDVTVEALASEKVCQYQKQLRELASQVSLSEERERRRIAAELHDRTIQSLGLCKVKMGVLGETLGDTLMDSEHKEMVDEIRHLLEQSIRDTRSLVFELSPPVLYELGFEPAVEWLAERMQNNHGINCSLDSDGLAKPLAPEVEVAMFQAVRELLVNVAKHATALRTQITIRREEDTMVVSVEDNGSGFDTLGVGTRRSDSGGFGLFSIRERIELLGGSVEIRSARGQGTCVTMKAPIQTASTTRPGFSEVNTRRLLFNL